MNSSLFTSTLPKGLIPKSELAEDEPQLIDWQNGYQSAIHFRVLYNSINNGTNLPKVVYVMSWLIQNNTIHNLTCLDHQT